MGNSASSSRAHQDDTVDYGFLTPQGVYTGNPDWNQQVVAQLIIDRRLAPFYRPLEEYDDNWDDEQILAARKSLPEDVATSESVSRSDGGGSLHSSASRSNSVHSSIHPARRPAALKEPSRIPEAMVYRGAIECPICFLYYPPNINHSRCCDQAICTECFVQIKRSEPTTTHVVSEPAACPYCVQENFGVTYNPPSWRAGIGADGYTPITVMSPRQQTAETKKSRRKSFGADSAEVVTIDHIRPDWEAKLAAVRAAVARRANRRIIMRQVGDRLIPVGVTSGRIHPLNGDAGAGSGEGGTENANEGEGRASRRSRRRQHQQHPQDINQLLGTMGLGGQDLEELMVMEAMRLSLLEHEEQQRREAEEKRKKEAERIAKGEAPSNDTNGENEAGPSSSAPGLELPPLPTTSPINVAQSSNRGLTSTVSPSPGGRSVSLSPRSSPAPGSLTESEQSSRPSGPSSLNALVTASLGVSSAHSGSRTHSRSGSATPSVRSPTPREGTNLAQFSTLSAALATHGAASAVLAASGGGTSDSVPTSGPSTCTTSAATQLPNSQPEVVEPTSPQGEDSPALAATNAPKGVPEAEANRSVSSLISGNIEGQSYDELPSSPDSPSHRPLLLETPVSEVPGMTLESHSEPHPGESARGNVPE
ncbi:uncharacterized protein FOMMEDRAFT_139279 [Fomitiporia mediterranea MF3/22]|uniref:uncharacterized protein n=1 Tax=Fomitiporia mediterranea (strain MF3/22) TaxID=694068 RepID=UPI0004407579|nr:uncharacterized protein FOMMEDRAFT_139279 [Fomitiporia mediterranea MF3/22]EJD05978.1 hypothetical protein FOMMEDRAFT_139279 [Fomitiporia mediterranea MF3/22]